MKNVAFLLVLILSVISCEVDYDQLKPDADVNTGTVYIVINQSILETSAGKALKAKMEKTIHGTYPFEKIRKTYYVDIDAKSNSLNRSSELVIVKINKDPKYATPEVVYEYDLYARGQIYISVTVNNLQTLNNFILEDWDSKILAKLDKFELNMIVQRNKGRRHKSSQKSTDNRFGIDLVLPNDFALNEDEPDFIWMTRKETQKTQEDFTVWVQQGILIWQVDYVDQSQFNPDSLLAQRDSVLKKMVPYEDKQGYMATEYMEGFEPVNKIYESDGVYHVDLSGMWKIDGDPAIHMGGPFYQTSFYNKKTGKIITVCAYTHAAGVSKRKLHLNMRAWLSSIRIN